MHNDGFVVLYLTIMFYVFVFGIPLFTLFWKGKKLYSFYIIFIFMFFLIQTIGHELVRYTSYYDPRNPNEYFTLRAYLSWIMLLIIVRLIVNYFLEKEHKERLVFHIREMLYSLISSIKKVFKFNKK